MSVRYDALYAGDQFRLKGHSSRKSIGFQDSVTEGGITFWTHICPCCGKTSYFNSEGQYHIENCTVTPELRAILDTLPYLFNNLYERGVTDGRNQLDQAQGDSLSMLTLALSYVIHNLVDNTHDDIRMHPGKGRK